LRERQLQATLNHPSIAHIHDAGHNQHGRPYLVMEYVDGLPLDEYAARLPLHEKLQLFLRVCDGISHAHRHLIIHRDLKPSNILVDASGQPKILDFGLAKLLDESADATQTSERLLTPNYASPEQLRGAPQTTATDVYSLGAVLYKLLTNRSPHESDTGASLALEVITGSRQIVPASRQNPDLPSDLDYVLKKALRLEPEERYESVDAFASDVEAFLDARPVSARAGDRWYRLRVFLQRRWLPVCASVLTLVGLSTGLYLANRSRIAAEKRFEQLRQLSNRVFDLDRAIRDLPGATQARQNLVSASLEYLEGLAQDARTDVDLAREVSE
jgi:serine/threonine-protein kinase